MASGLSLNLRKMDADIRNIVNGVLKEYIELIYNEAMAQAPSVARGKYTVEVHPSLMRAEIWTEDDVAVYLEFGTGAYAAEYLSGKPSMMRDEAIKFFKTGKGKTPAKPYLFPTYYKYREDVLPEIDRRIQSYLDKL